MEIKIKLLDSICEPEAKGDWIDLKSLKDIRYHEGEFFTINLGVAMELPKGYEAHLLPRSSTFKKYGLVMVNSMGVIDEAYCGDNDVWKMQVVACKCGEIKAGERIAQFRIIEKQPTINFNIVKELGNADRGGIGSTGR